MGDWCRLSGLKSWQSSGTNDKPKYSFGIGYVDDASFRRTILSVAAVVPRHYVIMEVLDNLMADTRKASLKRFGAPHFKQIAYVAMGAPTKEFREGVHAELLKRKQAAADLEWKRKKNAQEMKKVAAKKKKEQQEAAAKRKKELEEKKAKALEEVKKKKEALEAKKKEAAAAEGKEGEEKKEEEKKEEAKEEPKKEEEVKKEEKDVEMKEEEKKEEEPEEQYEDLGEE